MFFTRWLLAKLMRHPSKHETHTRPPKNARTHSVPGGAGVGAHG